MADVTGAELKAQIQHAIGTGWYGLDLQDELDGCVVLTREEAKHLRELMDESWYFALIAGKKP